MSHYSDTFATCENLILKHAPALMHAGGGALRRERIIPRNGRAFAGHMKPVEVAQIKAMHAAGKSIQEIADAIGRSYNAVALRTRVSNIDRRACRRMGKKAA